ncbi:MAG: histidine kinase [Desulfobacterium sp.]|nr:histidine kinase [Desulfobacterium sp.]
MVKQSQAVIKIYFTSVLLVTAMVVAITAVDYGEDFVTNMIIGQSIGTTMFGGAFAVLYVLRRSSPFVQMAAAMAAMATGAVMGIFLGTLAAGKNVHLFFEPRKEVFVEVIILSIITGFLFRYILTSQKRISDALARIQREKIKRLTIEKQMVETNLRVLQAQIEPHFLFNTLSNILTLLETDLDKGKHMLEDLTAYLRVTLSKTRKETTTLGQEIDMIQAYLNIYKIRMGERLDFTIQVPEYLRHLPLPPMLIQPLVENAIEHGLEPKIEGGAIWVSVRNEKGCLAMEVKDSGLCFHKNNHDWGVGLTNIRNRLKALYEDKAALTFEENTPSGLIVTIEVPV